MGLPQFLGYASGDAANNVTFAMSGMFLLLYYTDVVGIAAATAGTLFALIRIWNAFADLLAGRMVDRTMTRWGKFRPFFLFGSLPLVVLAVATFSVPGMVGGGLGVKIVAAIVTFGLMVTVYSLVNIPYGSLASAMAHGAGERAKLASFRVVGASVTSMMVTIVIAPQIKRFSDEPGEFQHALLLTMIVLGAVALGLYLFLFLTSQERAQRTVGQVSLRQSLAILRSNGPLQILCLGALAILAAQACVQILLAYYARDVLGNANYLIVLVMLSSGAIFVVGPFIPRLVRRFGKKRAVLGFVLIGIVGAVGFTFGAPAIGVSFAAFLLWGISAAGINSLMWALEADTVEYGEWRTDVRAEGSIYAVFSFTRRIGMAVGGAVGAYGIGIGGYVAGQAVQSDATVWAIRISTGLVAALFLAIGFVVLTRYPLSEKAYSDLVIDIATRRSEPEA